MFRCAGGLLGGLRRGLLASAMALALLGAGASGASAAGLTAYVVGYDPDNFTAAAMPIDLASNTLETPIPFVNANPFAIAITPDGSTAYVLANNNTLTPIDTATNTPETPIPVGSLNNNESTAVAISPDGSTAYVPNGAVNNGSSSVTPVDLATNTAEPSISFDGYPNAIAITPDGSTAYVLGTTYSGSGTVTPIDLATSTPEPAIQFGGYPNGIAITPDGSTAYVTDSDDDTVTPIDLATNTPEPAIQLSGYPSAIAITPDGSTAYVATYNGTVVPIDLATNTPGTPITVGGNPNAIAITPDGLSAYVVASGAENYSRWTFTVGSGTVTPIDLVTNTPGTPITVGNELPAIAITPAVFGAPTATITSPKRHRTYTVGETVTTSFSCTDASDGSGISSCVDSNQSTSGSGLLNTASARVGTYSVKATSRDGRTATASITYTVELASTTTTTTPTPATPTTTATPATPVTPPPGATQISQVSMTSNVVLWCRGHGCRYPSTALRFMLNDTATIRLALRTSADGHWKQVATTNLHGHRGFNSHRLAGRWHGHLVPAGPVQILVQIRRDHHWTTARNMGLTVRHTR